MGSAAICLSLLYPYLYLSLHFTSLSSSLMHESDPVYEMHIAASSKTELGFPRAPFFPIPHLSFFPFKVDLLDAGSIGRR